MVSIFSTVIRINQKALCKQEATNCLVWSDAYSLECIHPGRTFCNFRTTKSNDRRITRGSEKSSDMFPGSKIVKFSVRIHHIRVKQILSHNLLASKSVANCIKLADLLIFRLKHCDYLVGRKDSEKKRKKTR